MREFPIRSGSGGPSGEAKNPFWLCGRREQNVCPVVSGASGAERGRFRRGGRFGGGISVRGFEAAQRGFILYFIGKRGEKVRVFARRCG